MTGYPRRFEGLLWCLSLALVVSGLLLVPAALELRWGWLPPLFLPPDSGRLVAALHGVAAALFAAAYGAIWVVHMRSGWRRRRHRGSGIATAASLGALLVTGWAIYYAGERLGAWSSAAHLVLGFGAPGAVWLHVRRGKRGRLTAE